MRPHNRQQLAAEGDLAARLGGTGTKGTEEAVGIADGERGDAALAVDRMGGAIADRLAGARGADLQNRYFQRHGMGHRIWTAADGASAVKGDAGADHLEMKIAIAHQHPAELASDAGMPGNWARTVWKRASWVRLFSCDGWSAQARWLMTICGR